jgi:spermidine synthase
VIQRLVIWSIIGTGVSSITVQLLTIREFLSQFRGNEITISLVLFCWLFLTGIGSLLARLSKKPTPTMYALLNVLIATWPLLQIVVIRTFRDRVFVHGAAPDFYAIFFYIMSTTAPYCILVGFALPYALQVLKVRGSKFTAGDLYINDSIGDIAGGILFSFVLVYWVKPFTALALTSGLLIIASFLILFTTRKVLPLLPAMLAILVFYVFALDGRFEESTLSGQYGDIRRYLESPYGRVVITMEGPQRTFWESGVPLYSDADIVRSEEKIHYPLSQLDRARNVLLISGGLGETVGEVSKHRPDRIDYVELDPFLTAAAQELGLIEDHPFLEIVNTDGREYIRKTARRYDAIIMDLPEPDTFQVNRFFTSEFFGLCKRNMTSDGVLSFGVQSSPNYISEVRAMKLATIYHTARQHFRNVIALPGEEVIFLCRDGRLWTDIPARLKTKGIETTYIEGFYHGNVTAERIDALKRHLSRRTSSNQDLEPRLMSLVFREWFQMHGTSPRMFLIVFCGLTILYVAFMRREEYVLFATGLVTMGVEMLVVFSFQIIYGYIYLKIGAVVTAFLMGLLPGSILGNRSKATPYQGLIRSDIALLVLLLLFLLWISLFRGEPHPTHFLAYCFAFSFFCGYQFPTATRMIGEERSPAAGCLAADLAGAAVGTLVTGALLIPLWGMKAAIIFLILIKISSNIIILLGKRGRN